MDIRGIFHIICDLLLVMGMAVVNITEAVVLRIIPRRYRSKSVKGEVALITGGAGGIGKIIAAKLANLGCNVVIWDINKVGIEQTVAEIRQGGGKCWGYYCDISDRKCIYRNAKSVQVDVGNVTILINNAGYIYGDTLLKIPDDEIERTFNVNILSHYWTTKAFLKDMIKDNHGHIVTVASVAGLLGTYNCTDYSATKFATVGFHESLFSELKTHGYDGIQGLLVCPYFINTGMFPGVKPRLMSTLEPEYVAEEIVSGILTNRMLIILPSSIRWLLLLKHLLPVKMCWAMMYHVARGPQTMMMLARKHTHLPETKSDDVSQVQE
ncbi:estradiol 17-beta-dehydrogenase 11-like [Belonocnema kinseyi]|uniref:estradiol 17-beta-dehydrogenase 11-like n=1 Tax=Belonocnema kinseyi TaxID=2817044 RepID=UPI00143D9DDA|nr:estradiol 17-beta-dehydrogenase 11-like [Belonocnema kinseyi]XP_033219888.1 estradiol 17-beta-dehydrogenase 11-like [Belonocnema kinseyi]